MKRLITIGSVGLAGVLTAAVVVAAQQQPAPSAQKPPTAAQQATGQPAPGAAVPAGGSQTIPAGVTPPADYVIGPGDVLAVLFWREKDLSVEHIVVRPDGMITLPIINDIHASGLTPDELRRKVMEAAGRYVEDANATVVVKDINSRRVFVTGQVQKPGPYPLGAPTTVLQMLSMAGGVSEFAKKSKISVMRTEGSQTKSYKFNYKEVVEGKNLQQNILLKPGDTIVVP
jgi:polysaccharide export outer membrane protein